MQRKPLLVAGIVVLVLAVVGVAAAFGTVGADSHEEPSDDRAITVDATGEAEAAPNMAVVEVGVTSEGDDPAQIRDDLAVGADELRTALDELGVEYETSEFAIDRTPRHYEEEPDRPDYRGVHAFEVSLDDPDRIGEVIDAAADVGAEIADIELTLTEQTQNELRDEAIENAMSDARHQADTIATAGNLDVTSVKSVDASQRSYRTVSYEADAVADDAAPRTEIDIGDVSVSYEVKVTYEATEL